ncbi:MAG: hypothetical protein A2148_01890 [Chloroflexi bacterium RBG_16_68_14]|nr:MAG: hypothetical protein A2148_01890 [Chloroflexi bacterium RBG_16_68_14]
MSRRYWVGTSGWVYPHWRDVFYPRELKQREWFAHYARHFSTVEINNTFYRLPKEGAWEQWCRQAPSGFRYAVKGSRFITHIKRLRGCEEPVETFVGRARLLGDHLGPVLWQLPPQMKCDLDRLESFLMVLPRDVRHAFEFRRRDWFQPETFATLRRYDAAFCAYHMVDSETPLEATSDIAYLRFHGSNELYGGRYSDRQLAGWAGRLRALPEDVREVYVYFNNDAFGYAIENAATLRAILREAGEAAD